jgi:UDP-GlcNAc:undecaprenyl-phosphate/decaprenyl-phosphate GlcNAc-1-phosphate transferase
VIKTFALPFGIAFLVSFLACPLLAKVAPYLGLMDAPNQPRKNHPRPIPRVGGIAIALAIIVTLACLQMEVSWPLWLGILGMTLAGLGDDLLELSALPKFILQILFGVLLWYFGTRVTLFIPSTLVSLVLTVGWFVWVVNALNYMDNSNGLCAGVGVIILSGIAFIHLKFGNLASSQVGISTLMIVGALVGFLFWNFPKGRVFLGDHGSHLVGAAIAALIMQTTFVHANLGESPWAILSVPFLVLIPVIDFVQVTVGRWRRGQPIWQADTNHLAHLLVRRGWTSSQAVMILWLATGVSVCLGILVWRLSL